MQKVLYNFINGFIILLYSLSAAQNTETLDKDSDSEIEIEAPKIVPEVNSLIILDNRIIRLPEGFCEFTDRHLAPTKSPDEVINKNELETDKNQSGSCCVIQ